MNHRKRNFWSIQTRYQQWPRSKCPYHPTPSDGSGGWKSSGKYALDDNCVRATIASGALGGGGGVLAAN